MNELEKTKNKEEWFFEYKKFIAEHSNTYDQPTTIYDCFKEEEIYLMQRVIETECYDQDFISKANVASVLLNRINSGKFGETVVEVVTSPNQFVYGREIITKSTILALEYAFKIEDTANGCIAFRSDKKVENWGDWKYVFSDDAGHHFYREKGE